MSETAGTQTQIFDTYKSLWKYDNKSRIYLREHKNVYPFEDLLKFSLPYLQSMSQIRTIVSLLERKEQGVDFYKYYIDIIEKNQRSKWDIQFKDMRNKFLKDCNISLENKKILDVSGEPGFFAQDAQGIGAHTVTTAFAQEVANAMKYTLHIDACKFDYQSDNLQNVVDGKYFDVVFARWSIGFCLDLKRFFDDCNNVLKESGDGLLYISFSPPSLGVCARWMFDDYTYLIQYPADYLITTAFNSGFFVVKQWNEGKYLWDKDLSIEQKLLSSYYLEELFRGVEPRELFQYNTGILFAQKNQAHKYQWRGQNLTCL